MKKKRKEKILQMKKKKKKKFKKIKNPYFTVNLTSVSSVMFRFCFQTK